MYTSYYGFREKPFSLSPDPRFLYLSGAHREVLGHLVYGIEQGEGFMAITGEVGTGKTTLCRTLLRRLGSESEVAFLFNPTLTPLELLKAINGEFGLSTFGDSRPELTDVLNAFLLEQRADGRRVLLIIDEAQNLSTETLEQLRLLSNLETETSKLLQIVLLGQPELDQKLEARELRQLQQRISVWWHLGPIDAEETREYVRHRLRVAGALERPIFTDSALRTVHQLSGGVPRVINLLCDRALLAGYAEQKAQIDRRLVLRAATEMRPARPRRRRAWLAAGVAAALALGAGGLMIAQRTAEAPLEEIAEAATPPPLPPVTAPAVAPRPTAPELPPPAQPIVEGELEPVLALRSPAAEPAAVLDAVLVAWGLPPAGEPDVEFDELRHMLASQQIELLPIDPDLEALRRAATPAVVALRDDAGEPHWALLRSLSEDRAELEGVLDQGTIRVTLDDLLRHLDGEVYAVWRDFESLPDVLALGATGDAVTWLQSALAELGFYTAEVQGRFDESTREAVSLFQKVQGIPSDGVVDARTLMTLYEALPRYVTPNLDANPVDLAHAS